MYNNSFCLILGENLVFPFYLSPYVRYLFMVFSFAPVDIAKRKSKPSTKLRAWWLYKLK